MLLREGEEKEPTPPCYSMLNPMAGNKCCRLDKQWQHPLLEADEQHGCICKLFYHTLGQLYYESWNPDRTLAGVLFYTMFMSKMTKKIPTTLESCAQHSQE